ncbi:MAG: hypothetical protein R3B70_08400 [Polyangiaceae bacterium]
MSYGTERTLFDPRTARPIVYEPGESGAKPGIEDSGIRPGAILWVVRPEEPEPDQG